MAFTLTLQDDIGAGFSVLFAMLLKMIPVSNIPEGAVVAAVPWGASLLGAVG